MGARRFDRWFVPPSLRDGFERTWRHLEQIFNLLLDSYENLASNFDLLFPNSPTDPMGTAVPELTDEYLTREADNDTVLTTRPQIHTLLDTEELNAVVAMFLQTGLINRVQIDANGHVRMQGVVSALQLHTVTEIEQDAIPVPERGMLSYNEDSFSYDAYFEVGGPGTGAWLTFAAFPAFAFGSNATGTTTPIVAINTPVAVASVLTASGSEIFFTLGGGGLIWTYTGPNREDVLQVRYEGSVEKATGGIAEDVRFLVRINGINSGVAIQVASRQNEPTYWKSETSVLLNTNDTVQLFIENLSNNGDMTIREMFCVLS